MNTKLSTDRKLKRMLANILSIVVILALAFPVIGVAYAQDEPPPPNPFIAVSITEHWFWVNNFAPETLVTFSIYGDQGDENPILEFSKPTDALGNLTIDGWAHIWDPEPGDYIVATDGFITKDLVLEYITLDVFDHENDLVSGHTLPGREVGVGVGNETGEQWMNVFADEVTGEWLAQFEFNDEDYLTGDSWAGGHVNDEDGDVTAAHNFGPPEPPAWFTAFPEQDAVEAWDFPLGAVVHLAINDPTTEDSPDYVQDGTVMFAPWGSWQLWVWFDFAGMYDMKAGDIVTLTYGETVRTHTVQNLTVTKANHDDNTIKGTADPGAEVYVWPHATGEQLMATAKTLGAAKGKWSVDFSGIYDIAPGECGRSEIRDGEGNSTAVDWCISNPRIVASEAGDWFWTTEFKPGDLDISIYDSPDEGANLLWSGQQVADESGFAFVGFDIHGQDLVPGNFLVISDGDSQKSLILQPIFVTMFDTQYEFMAGFAPAGSEVWAAAGPQDWQERIMVTADPVSGEWFANFAEIGFDITEDMQPWSYAHIYDEDGDANEGGVPPLETWIAIYTYDYGKWEPGNHNYYLGDNWGHQGNPVLFDVSADAPLYDGYALLRGTMLWAQTSEGCQVIDALDPDQLTRFHSGWPIDYPMTYAQAVEYFDTLAPWVVVDDGAPMDLELYEIVPFSPETWQEYFCTFTAGLVLDASQPDWVDAGITVSAGQSFTIEAFGYMNPCSDTYPSGANYCIFYTPEGAEGVVPYQNEFGVFPGPGLPFMALLGRIGNGEPFYIGAGGTFTAEQTGTLWLIPNDNLRTDNQGAYRVRVGLEP